MKLEIDRKLKSDRTKMYSEALTKTFNKGIELGFLIKELKEFDLEKISNSIDESRDFNFTYLKTSNLI